MNKKYILQFYIKIDDQALSHIHNNAMSSKIEGDDSFYINELYDSSGVKFYIRFQRKVSFKENLVNEIINEVKSNKQIDSVILGMPIANILFTNTEEKMCLCIEQYRFKNLNNFKEHLDEITSFLKDGNKMLIGIYNIFEYDNKDIYVRFASKEIPIENKISF